MNRCIAKWSNYTITRPNWSPGILPISNRSTPQLGYPLDNAYAGDVDAIYLGTFNEGDAGMEVIRIRRTCYVPPVYEPMFLEGPMTPCEAWEMVVHHIYAQGQQVACTALVNFTRGTITRPAANAMPLLCIAPPHAPLADGVLLEHRHQILERDFPVLNQALPRLQQNAIATQFGRLVTDNRLSREEAKLRCLQAKENPLSNLVGDQGIAQLLRMANVRMEDTLPGILTCWKSTLRCLLGARSTSTRPEGVVGWNRYIVVGRKDP